MEIICENKILKISNIHEFNNFVIKEYENKYKFVDHIVFNEIEVNKKLFKLGIVHIPKLLAVEKNLNTTKLYFEKIDGRTLSSMKLSYFTFEEKFRILYKILNIIKLLHMNNIIHNDLRFSNILLTDNKEVYLIDFALSTSFTEKSNTNEMKSINSIVNNLFGVDLNLKFKDIHKLINKIGELKYELLYKR